VCSGKFVETGWIRGIEYGMGDVLQQYVTFIDLDGQPEVIPLGTPLANSTWYQFKVMYSNSAARWEAWLGANVVWYQPYSLGWTIGGGMAAGSENMVAQGWMDVSGWHPEYQPGPGTWILYNYSSSATAGGGHIAPAYDYGYHAWGP
jgi:hypothetical protein